MHSFISSLHPCVVATKRRETLLMREVRERLWPYLGGIACENGMKALAIGGVADHVHILLSLPATMSISKAMQLLKGNSSKWIHETFPALRSFAWQERIWCLQHRGFWNRRNTRVIRDQEEAYHIS